MIFLKFRVRIPEFTSQFTIVHKIGKTLKSAASLQFMEPLLFGQFGIETGDLGIAHVLLRKKRRQLLCYNDPNKNNN